jgi:hypothetical protein
VISILEGMNPHMLETKLTGFFAEAHGTADTRENKAKAASA